MKLQNKIMPKNVSPKDDFGYLRYRSVQIELMLSYLFGLNWLFDIEMCDFKCTSTTLIKWACLNVCSLPSNIKTRYVSSCCVLFGLLKLFGFDQCLGVQIFDVVQCALKFSIALYIAIQ